MVYCECCRVGVEDVQAELLKGLFEDDVHHGVLLTVLSLQIIDLKYNGSSQTAEFHLDFSS